MDPVQLCANDTVRACFVARLDYESLYERVCKQAVRRKHGQYHSQADTQAKYLDGLQRSRYNQQVHEPPAAPGTNGRPFEGGGRQGGSHLRSPVHARRPMTSVNLHRRG